MMKAKRGVELEIDLQVVRDEEVLLTAGDVTHLDLRKTFGRNQSFVQRKLKTLTVSGTPAVNGPFMTGALNGAEGPSVVGSCDSHQLRVNPVFCVLKPIRDRTPSKQT